MCLSALETICDKLLSSFAFNFNVRRYNKAFEDALKKRRAIFTVGRCRLTL
jgi:hypothetical protein